MKKKSQNVVQNITTTSMKKTIPSDHLHRWSLLHCNLHWVDHHKHISSVYQNINRKGALKKIQKQEETSCQYLDDIVLLLLPLPADTGVRSISLSFLLELLSLLVADFVGSTLKGFDTLEASWQDQIYKNWT